MMAKYKKIKAPWPVWKLILADIVLLGLALLVFALFHHVLPAREAAVGTVSKRVASAETPAPTAVATPMPTATTAPVPVQLTATPMLQATPETTAEPTPVPTPDPVGYFGTKFADKFTDGEIVREENKYQSANVNVTINQVRELGTEIYIADIYVKDISCLQNAFGKDTFGRGFYEWPKKISARKNAIVTINGDFCGGRNNGVVLRNGVLYRDDPNLKRDVGVIYWDGTMECFGPKEFDVHAEMERGAYQVWNFGPMLLDANGNTMTEFNSKVGPRNPRAAIGYFEPGHYCLVVVDGRSYQSVGMSLENLSIFMANLGCKQAYNLDGGETAAMAVGDELISVPADGGRVCSDFVMVIDQITETFEEAERG